MADKIGKWLKQMRQHMSMGHIEITEGLCRKILRNSPGHTETMLKLALCLNFKREMSEAIETLESILQHEPDNAEARTLLLFIFCESGGDARAIPLAHEILEHSEDPDELLAAYLACDLMCDWEHAARIQELILALGAQGRIKYSLMPGMLMHLNTATGVSPERMFELHRVWGKMLEQRTKQHRLPSKARSPKDGKLKIGYLSADFYRHPVGHFIQSPITHHDRDRFEVYCYAHVVFDDERTERIRQKADHFIDITQLSAYESAQRIRRDDIDILIELGGNTALSRMSTLAFQPAPVQITYLGYPNTTGLSTVDFRITDAFAEDTEHGTQYIEKLLYMPQSFLCAEEFMQDVPRIDVTPAVKNGYITFGSFNHVRKLNLETIALWSRILQGVKDSRLLIKSRGCEIPVVRDNILAAFARHGIEAERIQFHALIASHAEHAAIYNEVDIALDSFPYNGTTTTCETLWIGVPVVTLVGPQHVQRTSYSILKNIGLDATIAHTPDEYVEKAINLSSNTDNLNVLRQCLPKLIQHSPLGQPEVFARQLEALYERAWEEKTGIKTMASTLSGHDIDAPNAKKQPLRLIHNLARSGSTLMCKCLGSMQDIDLLSEIHPKAVSRFNPLDQAHEWFGLLTPEDIAYLQNHAPSFIEAIRLIDQRSRERNETLVVRDWAHLDFVGLPFLPTPTYRLGLAEVLADTFELKQIAFVRHPIDLWLSLSRLEIMRQPIASGRFGIDEFIHGYLRFAQQCADFGFIRYEDFTHDPEATMREVCERLDLPYDPSFMEHWSSYTTITGDVVSTRGGNEIKQLKRRDVSRAMLEAFATNPEYAQLLTMLGYEDESLESQPPINHSETATAPEVSVLMLAYNQEPFVRQAVQGLLNQDYQGAMEIIFSDDASSDRTAEIIEEEIANYQGPFTIRFNRNHINSGGVVAHLNHLMEMAKGRLIIGASGDDISLPYRVRRTVDAWNDGAGGSVFRMNPSMIDATGNRLGQKFLNQDQEHPDIPYQEMVSRGFAQAWANAWDRSVFDVFGPLPCTTRNEDQLIPFRGALLNGYKFIPGDFMEYRMHQNNLSIWRKMQLATTLEEKNAIQNEHLINLRNNHKNWREALVFIMDDGRIDRKEAENQLNMLDSMISES